MFPLPNELIAALTASEQSVLMRRARLIELKCGDILTSPDSESPMIYFITSGSVVLFVPFKPGYVSKGLAVGLIGREGAVGLQSALGLGVGSFILTVQSAGYAYVMEARYLQNLIKRYPGWLMLFSRYLWTTYQGIAKLAAMSHSQDIKLRLMHWLLLSAKRCEPDQLYMTHDHIAKMLGVRRASITLAAKELKDEGLMDYSRGRIRLLDIAALHKRTLT